NFLNAITDNVQQFTSKENINKYNLGTSANVLQIKKALTKKEIIDSDTNKTVILDPFYKLWLMNCYFKAK
ncbi:MAG: hypothetical protein HY738_21235, partial [Bacteroidia bacterium]|nr:hypothetical protein [Bacteroidia bacterium]